MLKHIAVYPGTFDPATNGHLDLVERSLRIFGELVIAVAENPKKKPLFSLAERIEMLRAVTKDLKNVSIEGFDGLLIDYVKQKEAVAIVRGLRAISDFEYEMQMALTNRRLYNDIETVFMMPNEAYSFITSTVVKEVASFGGDVSTLVPPVVLQRLKEKFGK
ncbi:MAG: pantetheine-phosphate adenylyltransferase [Nitrospirota bacterium]